MASTITTSFQFRLIGVTGTPFNTRTRQNVKKHIAKIVYLEEPPSDAVRLSYVGSKEITPVTNLFIGDRSDAIYANSQTSTTEEFIAENSGTPPALVNTNFLVTQEFVEADSGYIPLYFKHSLSLYVIPESVKVFDKDFNEVGSDKWKLSTYYEYDETDGSVVGALGYYVFNSLENSYDSVAGTYQVYFVQYTTVIGTTETTTTEILNNERAYVPAEYDDFWALTPGELKPWVYVYHLEDYDLVLPASGKLAVKYVESQRVSVKHPVDYTDTEPWFPRIVNGSFRHGYAGYTAEYDIAEFQNQSFSPIEPYKVAVRKLSQKVDDRLLKLPHEEIQVGAIFTYISIVFEKDGVAEHALTTDPSVAGTTYYDFNGSRVLDSNGDEIEWSSDDFLGLDKMSGIVHVDFDISDSHDIYATYPYKENYYALTGVIMNPIFDRDVHKQTRVIYIVPKNAANNNSATQTASVMWLKVSRSGVIQDTNQDGTSNNENIKLTTILENSNGYRITGVIGMHYSWEGTAQAQAQSPATTVEVLLGQPFYVETTEGFPREGWLRAKDTSGNYRYFKYTDKTDLYFELSNSTTEVPTSGTINIPDGGTVELVNFIQERSMISPRSSSEELAAYVVSATYPLPTVFSQYFILAEMSVNPPYGKEGLSVIDVREDGGGIDVDKYDEAKVLNPQVQWFNDYESFDGQIYPSNAAIVIKLPKTILDDFTLDNIREIAKEKVPFGIYPLIRFYGYEPRIISVLPGSAVSSVVVQWEKEGPEFVYDIWYAHDESGPWTRANTYLLTDSTGSYNSFTIEGLSDEAPYLVKITMQDRYYSWWYGYNGYNSIAGGLGLDESTPVPPFGNVANFQFRIL